MNIGGPELALVALICVVTAVPVLVVAAIGVALLFMRRKNKNAR